MGASVRFISLACAAAALAMLFEPFFSELLREIGIDSSTWVRPMIGALGTLAVVAKFPGAQGVALVIVGIAAGVWLHYVASGFDRARRRPSPAERFRSIAGSIGDAAGKLEILAQYWRNNLLSQDLSRQWPANLYGELLSLSVSMREIGLRFPTIDDVTSKENADKKVNYCANYLRILEALAYNCRVEEGIREGDKFTSFFYSQFPAADGAQALDKERG